MPLVATDALSDSPCPIAERIDAEEGANHDLQRIPSRRVRLKRAEDERKAGRPFDPSVANGYKIDDDSGGDRSSGLRRQTQLTELGMEDPATEVIFCKNELFRIPAACASFLWLFLNTCFLNLIGFIYRAYYYDRVDDAKERNISRKILCEEECEITVGDEKNGFSDQNAADRKRDDDEDGAVYCKLLQHLSAEQEVIELSLEDQSDSSQTDSGLNKGGSDSSKHTERKMEVAASKPDSKKERTPIALSFLRAEDFGYYMEAMNRTRGGNREVEMEVSSSVGSNFDDSSEGGTTESTFDEDEFLTEADFIYFKPRPTSLSLSSAGDLEEETNSAESESLEDLGFSYGFLGEKSGADGKIELVFLDSFPKIAEKEDDRDEDDESGIASSVSSEQNEWINDFMVSTTLPQYEVGDQESIGDTSNHSEMQGLPNSDDLLQFRDTDHRNSCEDQDKNHHRSKLHDQLQFQSPQSGNTCEDQARKTDHHTETNPDDLLQFQGTQCRNPGDDQVKNHRHQADPCDLLQLQIPQSENSVEDQGKSTDRHTDPDDMLQLLHASQYRKEPPQLQTNSDNAEDTTDLHLHTNNQHPDIVLANIRDLELPDHKKSDSEIGIAVLITAEFNIQKPHSPAKTREDSLNEEEESFCHSPLDFDGEDGVNVRENRKATSSPSSGWAEEEDDGFEELWEHQDFIEQLRSDLRKARATGLPTIKEETEWPMEKVMDDLKQWKTTTGKRTAHLLLATAEQDPMEELRTFYRSYSQRMRRFDVLNYQKTYAMGFLKLRDPIRDFASLKPTAGKGPISKSDDGAQSRPSAGFLRELHVDLETVYVGQMCLSWEFLHWQYVRTQELYESNPQDRRRHYEQAADEFQSFHVLLTRFTEDERFKGPRVHNYVNTRCAQRNMLQVPLLREEKTLERMDGEEGASLQCLVQVMEECMRAFWEFIKSDKGEAAPAFIKGLKQVENQNLVDAERLADIKASAQKKDKRLKDLMKSGSCLVKRFQRPPVGGWMNESLFLSLVDVALVKRVVKMTRVTREQAEWCQNKLLNIHFKNRNKLMREQSFLLFPC